MNLKDLYESLCVKLKNFGIKEYHNEVDIILKEVLNVTKVDLLTYPNRKVSLKDLKKIEYVIYRRELREPLAYILQHQEFYGFRFKVNGDVLIPRFETELIVEKVISLIRANNNLEKIVDVGTGCGNIAITIKKLCPQTEVVAVDFYVGALRVAKDNAKSLVGEESITILKSDMLLELISRKYKCDIIVSNPPYVTEEEYENLPPEIYFEPRHSLVCEKGVELYYSLSQQSRKVLHKDGFVVIEINPFLEKEIKKIFLNENFKLKDVILDYNNFVRGLVFQNNG